MSPVNAVRLTYILTYIWVCVGDEKVMGRFGVQERNLEGRTVDDIAKRMEMVVINRVDRL